VYALKRFPLFFSFIVLIIFINISQNLVIATYPVIKAANPEALVITAGLANGGYYNSTDPTMVAHCALKYTARMFAIPGFADSFDGFGVHPYMFGNGATPDNGEWGWNLWAELPQFYQLLVDNGVGHKQLWLTEVGCPSEFVEETEANQALIFGQYLSGLDNYRIQGNAMIEMAFIYELQDNPQLIGTEEGYFGIQRANGTQKPAATLVANWSFSPL